MKLAIIGLGVMGRNLALNFRDAGHEPVVWDAWPEARGWSAEGVTVCDTPGSLVESLATPRIILLMIKSGQPVYEMREQLCSLLDAGDIIIDGGNAHFTDTQTNAMLARKTGIQFAGLGVSGGAEGARNGPSMMLGCVPEVRDVLMPLLSGVAARHNEKPCVAWFGKGGAGHFVKMVHNGIEYAIMEAIAEAWQLLSLTGLSAVEAGQQMTRWCDGNLAGYLMEISGEVLQAKDKQTNELLIDIVDEAAGQKGTGGWCVQEALNLGVPVPSIMAAVTMRQMSSFPELRISTAPSRQAPAILSNEDIHDGLLASMALALVQGVHLLDVANKQHQWQIGLAEAARVWRQGSILRMSLLDSFADRQALIKIANECGNGLCACVMAASNTGLPTPVLSAGLTYLDTCNAERLPTALVQLQRDRFGAHGLKHKETGQNFHGPWQRSDT